MNVNQIEIALSQKIGASSTNFDLLAASKALQLLKTNGVFVVSSDGGLPDAASNEGKIYFVENSEAVVWSNGSGWFKLLDKTPYPPPTQLFSWGFGNQGQLGTGTGFGTCFCSPVREFCSANDWVQVSGENQSASALKSSGEIWSWGTGSNGQLGHGRVVSSCSPVREFCSATDWCQVSAGQFFAVGIKTSGQLWAWGAAPCGRLGDGTTVCKCSPVREISSSTDWCQVSAGRYHTAAIKTSGQIWSWGCNTASSLGDGTTIIRCSPVREFCSATDWCQASAGDGHTAAIKTSGELWAWGYSGSGRLGIGTGSGSFCSPIREFCSATDWCQVCTGSSHTAAIKTSGELWAWGSGSYGRLGDGSATGKCSPVREISSATDWCQVSVGGTSSAIKTTGELWVWGCNNCGNLGDGTTVSKCSPVREFCSATTWCCVSTAINFTNAIKIA